MNMEIDLSWTLQEAARNVSAGTVAWVVVGVVVLAVVYVVWKMFRVREEKPARMDPEQPVDVAGLGEIGPPPGLPSLEFSLAPVRLAAVVVAPSGLARELPSANRLDDFFDSVAPGLAAVVAAHRALIRRWPGQVSIAGFSHKFFSKARLPGDGGKGTPWCSAAGVFEYQGQPFLIGLVLRAASNNNHGQVTVEQPTKWLDLLRVRAN
ncbi:MAG: hypothetical protein HUU20_11280 [Pirellulales bacterium]|nr:hypothetical protein [Pirellulales bacterium]